MVHNKIHGALRLIPAVSGGSYHQLAFPFLVKHSHGNCGTKPSLTDAGKGIWSLFLKIIHSFKRRTPGKQFRLHINLPPGAQYLHGIRRPVVTLKSFSRQEYGGK